MSKPDFVFRCKKCGHNLFINATKRAVMELANAECPNCGEEPDNWNGLWIFLRAGDYYKEYGDGKEE